MTTQTPTPSAEGDKQSRYKGTLNLPKTTFAMKANLVQNEPSSMKRWEDMGLYSKLKDSRAAAGAPRFKFHDGPPYANGNIHLGHLLNKVLKDIVVRIQLMEGKACTYVPGWDCHGLPIEHKVMTELQEAGKLAKLQGLPDDQRRMAIRRECQKYAEKFIKLQAGQMKRLLTLADYQDPYLTMAPAYEGATLEVFADLVESGLVYRQLKSVHWSIANETALADAELEYYDREDISVFVDFEATDQDAVYDAFGLPQDDGEEDDQEESESESPRRPTQRPCFMIWTTTPWTLPANVAIAINLDVEYALARIDGNITIVAKELLQKVAKAAKADEVHIIATTPGKNLVGLKYRHPLYDSSPDFSGLAAEAIRHADLTGLGVYRIVSADYVTIEDGTGLVHTAPGHGADDYRTGLKDKLPIYCPVRENGTYDNTVPEWLRGKLIWDANPEIVEHLRRSGHLFHDNKFMHSYPHDWRGKSPVIFRATEQWFIGVDQPYEVGNSRDEVIPPSSLRQRSLFEVGIDVWAAAESQAQQVLMDEIAEINAEQTELSMRSSSSQLRGIEATKALHAWFIVHGTPNLDTPIRFVPSWGQNRMRSMLESRPDWCISRQRSWGLPIPAFYAADGRVLLTPATVRAVAKSVREKGSDVWFLASPTEILKHYDYSADTDAPKGLDIATLTKGIDIFDVWFESGCSWNSVMRERSGGGKSGVDYPVDLYLEGSDQHRGWFQVSLLTALGATGQPPYKTLLTHGFIVDKDGKKMSKSLGNTLEVEDLLKEFGADVCRWWVATLAYDGDIRADIEFFRTSGESYRKVRNTLRFMLSNLDGFDPARDAAPPESFKPTDLDTWILGAFDELSRGVRKAYSEYDFRRASILMFDFCNETLSSVYLAAIKDRLYCDAASSPRRRKTLSCLYRLTDGLCRLLAPILPHTADEAWRSLVKVDPKDSSRSIHLETIHPELGAAPDSGWVQVMKSRDAGLTALEHMRQTSDLDNPLDAAVVLPDPEKVLGRFDPIELADLMGASQVRLDSLAGPGDAKVIDLRGEARCERSWKRDGTVKQRSDGGMLCERCAAAIGVS